MFRGLLKIILPFFVFTSNNKISVPGWANNKNAFTEIKNVNTIRSIKFCFDKGKMKKEIQWMLISFLSVVAINAGAQDKFLLTPSRVFDGETMHEGWSVLVQNSKILQVGPTSSLKTDNSTKVIKY